MPLTVVFQVTFGLAIGAMTLSIILHPNNYKMSLMKDKRILIMDVTSAIGKETAYEYAKLDTKLAVAASDPFVLQEVAKNCMELGASRVEMLLGNVTDASFRETLVQKVEEYFGGLDHLILNHVSYPGSSTGPWIGTAQNLSALQDEMVLHFTSYVDIASKFLPLLIRSKGNIGVVTSLAGKVPLPHWATRSASEAALLGFFPALRQELYRRNTGVSVTAIALGYLGTETGSNAIGNDYPFFHPLAVTPLNEAAKAIIEAVALKRQELSFPLMSQVHFTLHNVFPSLYEQMLVS